MRVEGEAFTNEQWLEFAGRLHPLVLHLPIGLLAAVVLVELTGVVSNGARKARGPLYVALALSGVVAAASGWLLGSGEDYAGELVDEHRSFGIAAAVVATLAALPAVFGRSGRATALRLASLALCAALITVAGHHGGMLTHGRTFLSSAAPPWLAPWVGPGSTPAASDSDDDPVEPLVVPPTEPAGARVFAALRSRCFECHGPDKSKAGLRLDTVDGLLSVLEPGAASHSLIVERVRLPREDEEAMPPNGAPLDEATIAALETWIDAGAPTGDVERRAELARSEAATTAAALDELRALTGARVDELREDAVLAPSERRWEVDWSRTGVTPTADGLRALAPHAKRIAALNLAGLDLGDDVLTALPAMPALRAARLERTSLGDAAVTTMLERAPELATLNLHSTSVTEATLPVLADASSLERVLLHGTPLAELGAGTLAERLPGVELLLGDALPANPFAERPLRRVLAADASRGRIALLRERAFGQLDLLWEREIAQLHDLQWLDSTTGEHGRVLFQESWTRVLEVDTATDEVLWSYDAAQHGNDPVEIHSFFRVDDGSTWIAESGRAQLVQVDADGAIVHTIPLQVDAPDVHRDTRLVRPTPAGTFLVAHEGDGVVREYDRDGAVVWEFDVPLLDRAPAPGHGFDAYGDQAFCALRLDDGDTLIATGNGSSLLRVRPNGSLRTHIGQDDLFGLRLAWTTNVQRLSNGNLVLGNCHAGPDQPQAIELTPDGEPVWVFQDHTLFGDGLSNLVVVEASP